MDANNFSLQEMYMQVPLVTRTWLTGVVAVTVGAHFGLVPLYNLNLSFEHIFTKLQVWRLVTSFLFLGPLDLSWLINLFMVCVALLRVPLAPRYWPPPPPPHPPAHAPRTPPPFPSPRPAQLQAERGL
jgi:hypothetical protein